MDLTGASAPCATRCLQDSVFRPLTIPPIQIECQFRCQAILRISYVLGTPATCMAGRPPRTQETVVAAPVRPGVHNPRFRSSGGSVATA